MISFLCKYFALIHSQRYCDVILTIFFLYCRKKQQQLTWKTRDNNDLYIENN